MEIERVWPSLLRVTLHAYEMSALVAAARSLVDGDGEGELTSEAVDQLENVLASYDAEIEKLGTG
ncbi:MAG: hypothetical protein GWM92_20530 [Gemmatimonadetes bacterium]|nr:hypothetical protein [Gemmatimonadota bacterium]NIR81225.1 hypothetical protein [Gemmatimonadota bacterium]NIT90070.1 hypothetical protein [Gemmatimonadota bacterium]NIU33882.1 hypothetical protein [Gemmatimonadota bacterium]NIU38074.1 hypothetical protein [Gemmatimonadota bacterium]